MGCGFPSNPSTSPFRNVQIESRTLHTNCGHIFRILINSEPIKNSVIDASTLQSDSEQYNLIISKDQLCKTNELTTIFLSFIQKLNEKKVPQLIIAEPEGSSQDSSQLNQVDKGMLFKSLSKGILLFSRRIKKDDLYLKKFNFSWQDFNSYRQRYEPDLQAISSLFEQ